MIMQQNAFRKKSLYLETYKPFNKQTYVLPMLKAKKNLQLIKQKRTDSPQRKSIDKNIIIKFEVKCQAIELKSRFSPAKIRNKLSMYNFRHQNSSIENINLTSIGLAKHVLSLYQPKNRETIANPQDHYVSKTFQSIPQNHIMLNKQQNLRKKGEIIAFYIPTNQYVALYPVLSQILYPSQIQNLLPCFGIYENQKTTLKYYVGQMHQQESLKIIIKQFGCLKQNVAQRIIRQLVITILQLHQYGYSHNRINLKSIYVTTNEKIMFNIFNSSSKPLSEQEKKNFLFYFPPEMLLSRDNYSSKMNDIWAIGCLTLEILSSIPLQNNKYHPYNRVCQHQNLSESLLLVQQIQLKYKVQPSNQKKDLSLSAKSIDFILKCMRVRIQNRPSAQELLEHPFLKQ